VDRSSLHTDKEHKERDIVSVLNTEAKIDRKACDVRSGYVGSVEQRQSKHEA
jgi:hypothetical protein